MLVGMARPKGFEPDAALTAAMEVFWERGYEATSLDDLVERLGLSRSSIYGTFGSKHAIFLRALQRYLEVQDPSPIELLSRPGPALEAIGALFDHYAEISADGRGCLIVSTAAEVLPGDREAAAVVDGAWDALALALRSTLQRARTQGQLRPGADPAALADLLLMLLQGMRLTGSCWADRKRLRRVARETLRSISA